MEIPRYLFSSVGYVENAYQYRGVTQHEGDFTPEEMFKRLSELSNYWGGDDLSKVALVAFEVLLNSKNITPDFFLRHTRSELSDLDPSILTIMRAVCGPQPFTPDVLLQIRDVDAYAYNVGITHVWCTNDNPPELFNSLKITNDKDYAEYMKGLNLSSTAQTKTKVLIDSGLFDILMSVRGK